MIQKHDEPALQLRMHELDVRSRCHHPNDDAFTPFPRSALNESIWRRFCFIADAHADRPAVVTPDTSFTYRALRAMVDHIAHSLIEDSDRGDLSSHAGPVALFLGDDVRFYAAMLAAIKVGRPYLALDVNLPTERILYMLSDSGASTIVCNKSLWSDHSQLQNLGVHNLFIEDAIDTNSFSGSHHQTPEATACSEALVIYTSGSTGQPKGFTHRHRNVIHDIMNYTNAGRFCYEDRFILLSSLSFADSVRTIFGALLNGACLYPVNVKVLGFHRLADYIQDNAITVYRSVPTLFRHFVATLEQTPQFPHVRLLYLAGESVYRHDFNLFQMYFSDTCIMVNRLGTGEGLTYRSYFMDKNTHIEGSTVPVGFAVDDKDIRLLDDDGKPVDQPGVGEIAVHSEFLCNGYLNKPAKTEQTFLPGDPTSDARLYRTGDLGEIGEDGCLFHLGRKDFQLKVRGYRVELGEIETVLMEHAAVKEAVVVAKKSDNLDVSMTAFVTKHQTNTLSEADLKNYLTNKLPDYLIPTHIRIIPELPQTTTGKINRQALLVATDDHSRSSAPYAASNTDTQLKLTQIWCDILGIERIGIHDDFFQLGGDSLKAMRIIATVSSEFQMSISYRELLLDASTISLMSDVIDQAN